jgi:hypothetical protein
LGVFASQAALCASSAAFASLRLVDLHDCAADRIDVLLLACYGTSAVVTGVFFAFRIRGIDDQWGIRREFRAVLLVASVGLVAAIALRHNEDANDAISLARNVTIH